MKLKSAFLLSMVAFTILIMSAVCSAITLVSLYDGWAPYGKNFTGGEYTFMISGNSNMEQFVVNLPTGGIISIKDAGCYTKDYFMVCYNGSRAFDWLNVTLDKEYWNASINISKYVEEERRLEITKSYDYEEPVLIQEPISIKITLFNNASTSAKWIVLKDSVPAAFHITEIDGCEALGTNIRWSGTLKHHESHYCRYTIEASTTNEYSVPAEVTYILEDTEFSAKSTAENINVSIPLLEASSFLSNHTLSVGDILFYSINLTNVDQEMELMINKLNINIPNKIKVLKSFKLKETRLGWTFRDNLDKNESKDIWFLGLILNPGNDTIKTTIDYTIRGVFTQIALEDNISIDSNGGVEVNVSFDNLSNISDIVNISGLDILENLSLESNVSGADNVSQQENVSEEPNVTVPIITRAEPEKKPIPHLVVIGIVLIALILMGIIIIIKKRRESYY